MKKTLFVICIALALLNCKIAFGQFYIESESVEIDRTNLIINFTVTFNKTPTFFNIDECGRPENEFQYFFINKTASENNSYQPNIVIRGGEIYITNRLAIRDVGGTISKGSGGWGTLLDKLIYQVEENTMTFSADLRTLGITGDFRYFIETYKFGRLQSFAVNDITIDPIPPDIDEATYFLVAETNAPQHGDSYVLPLTKLEDINYARRLITEGTNIGPSGIIAEIGYWKGDGINPNRDYMQQSKPTWSWQVINFTGFKDTSKINTLYSPTYVEEHLDNWINDHNRTISFNGYSIVKELGHNLTALNCDLNSDENIDMIDLSILTHRWLDTDCTWPDWCAGVDINGDGQVNLNDFLLMQTNWQHEFK